MDLINSCCRVKAGHRSMYKWGDDEETVDDISYPSESRPAKAVDETIETGRSITYDLAENVENKQKNLPVKY